jgi:esterase/lipase
MIKVLRFFTALILFTILGIVAMFLLGSREPVDTQITFDPKEIGEDVDAYLASREANVPDLREGVAKRVIWAHEDKRKTSISVVYVHGFSATSEEIRPVPDKLATALGANLHFTRLTGHGRDGAAMGEPTAGDWINDAAEAIEIGTRIGERVLVISTSTGGTLLPVLEWEGWHSDKIAGFVFVAPNFGVNSPLAPILTLPGARTWLPILAGAERSFEPRNEAQAQYWTTKYPTVAALPMAALVKHVVAGDFVAIKTPALFMYSHEDKVVNPAKTDAVFEVYGGPKERILVTSGDGIDDYMHVIAGDIVSPAMTDRAVEAIFGWFEGQR